MVGVCQLERAGVCEPRLVVSIEAAQQLCAGRVQVVVVVELEPVDDLEPASGPVGLCDCDRPVQLDDRRVGRGGRARRRGRRSAGQSTGSSRAAPRSPPARRTARGPAARARDRAASRPSSICGSVPERAVLVSQQHELAVARAAPPVARRAGASARAARCASGSSGISSASTLPSRIASAARSPRPP